MRADLGACATALSPLVTLIRGRVFAADRIRGDDTTIRVLAKAKTITGRLRTFCATNAHSAIRPNR